jgi:integrase
MIESNPIYQLKAPKAEKKSQHSLDLEEIGRLLKAAQNTEWYVLILLALATSMRQRELFGLRWKYVNLPERYLRKGCSSAARESRTWDRQRPRRPPRNMPHRRRIF